jgi:hypothetical protein
MWADITYEARRSVKFYESSMSSSWQMSWRDKEESLAEHQKVHNEEVYLRSSKAYKD